MNERYLDRHAALTGARVRVTMVIAAALALSGCSGPFFYHDVIVPTYRQVDPATTQPTPGQPAAPQRR